MERVSKQRMFCGMLHELKMDNMTTLTLLAVLYIVLTTHICLIYISSNGAKSWRKICVAGAIQTTEIVVTVFCVLTGASDLLINVIGVAVIQTVGSAVYFLLTDETPLRKDGGRNWVFEEFQIDNNVQDTHMRMRSAGG